MTVEQKILALNEAIKYFETYSLTGYGICEVIWRSINNELVKELKISFYHTDNNDETSITNFIFRSLHIESFDFQYKSYGAYMFKNSLEGNICRIYLLEEAIKELKKQL